MALLVTDAVVLHAFDYLETSRILRLATRDAGVQSVLARGARRPRSRYGSALDLFAGGSAQMYVRPGRDLQTLAAFEVTRSRADLGADLDRFTAASAIAELMLRFVRDDEHPELFETLTGTLDALAVAPASQIRSTALGGAWLLVAQLGFAPSLDSCSACHALIADDAPAPFHHRSGGVLCARCARERPGGRLLPAQARARVSAWATGDGATGRPLPPDEARAHQRLLREFLVEHLAEDRPLRAFDVWMRDDWGAAGDAPREAAGFDAAQP
jgi:DNA repair protein RecO (recombination protein O)